jgi:hypothetical protein
MRADHIKHYNLPAILLVLLLFANNGCSKNALSKLIVPFIQ